MQMSFGFFDKYDVQGFNINILGVLILGCFPNPHPFIPESDQVEYHRDQVLITQSVVFFGQEQ